MLLLAHVGYTMGGGWAAQGLRLKKSVDFRVLAFMALLPDVIDRALYVFVFSGAEGGRLIAHTLVFNLSLAMILVLVRRDLWIYGLASLAHLLLDAHGLTPAQAFWPLLGTDLANVGLAGARATASYGTQVGERVKEIAGTYGRAGLEAFFLDVGGMAVLAALAWRERLYRPFALQRFALSGVIATGQADPGAVQQTGGAYGGQGAIRKSGSAPGDQEGSFADLHLHTSYSDGRLSPRELIELVVGRGLRVVAITDHNTTDGLREALVVAREHPDLQVIPAVELSTGADGVHILGYFVRYDLRWFQRELERLRAGQRRSLEETVEKLQTKGMEITWNRVRGLAGKGSFGRQHIARAMLERGYVSSIDEAFQLYLGRNGSVHTNMRNGLSPEEAARMVVRAGGLPVLAHPAALANPEDLVARLTGADLVGLEAYCGSYDAETVARLVELARRYHLLPLGGSDFHGIEAQEGLPGEVPLPPEPVRELIELAGSGSSKALVQERLFGRIAD